MRVRISYSVELEHVPQEVIRLLENNEKNYKQKLLMKEKK